MAVKRVVLTRGAYCKARQRTPLVLPSALTLYTGQLLSFYCVR
jgi:hypothetical protein